MEPILQFIYSISSDATYGRWLVIVMVASTVFAIALAFYFLFSNFLDPVRKRIFSVTNTNLDAERRQSSRVTNIGSSLNSEGDKSSYNQKRLLYAGFHSENAISTFTGIRIILIIALPLIAFLFTLFIAGISREIIYLILILVAIIGYMAPSIYLDKAVAKRQRNIRNNFPDVIDQLIVCTEAGLGIEAGLQRVAKNSEISSSIMSYELGLVNAELRAGITRQNAFNNLVLRTGVEEIKGFVSALAQSIRFGTNIADTMRVYADDLRDRRMQQAEEMAAKIGVKMMFPLVFCFFPGIFVVILAPAVLIIMKNFL